MLPCQASTEGFIYITSFMSQPNPAKQLLSASFTDEKTKRLSNLSQLPIGGGRAGIHTQVHQSPSLVRLQPLGMQFRWPLRSKKL
jgi:hypothetical protein